MDDGSGMTLAPARPPAPEPRTLAAELVRASQLTPRVRLLELRAVSAEPFVWVPGQYVEIAPRREERQPYSIASAPDAARPGSFELAVGSDADSALGGLALGAELDVRGPLGQFYSAPTSLPQLFVGMGTGLAPLRAMLEAIVRRESSARLVVLHGARDESEILWREEWEALAARDQRVTFIPTLTRASNSWHGRRGRVQAHFAEIVSELGDPEIYVCGVALAVRDCRRMLVDELGVREERVFVEGH
jgi:CDP-4-dehydro-6-deoxyglucose reductase